MTIDPEQIRAEIESLMAQLPDAADAEHRAVPAGARRHRPPPFRGARRAAAGAGVGGEGLSARMPRRARVDAELVRRGLARSRQQAAELIGAGKVRIDGLPAVKPATAVAVTAALTVADDGERGWVSRGRAQTHRRAGRLRDRRRGPALPGRRGLDRRVHRGPAGPRRRRSGCRRRRIRPAGLVAAQRSAGGRRRADQRARPVTRGDRRARSTWWSPTCRSSRWRRCCPRWLVALRPTPISFPW